jgi:hypothetical protein
MNKIKSCLKRSLRVLATMLICSGAAQAAVTSAFDGNWFDPLTAGQGFIFETYPDAAGELTLVVIHFTYDADGKPTFYTGSAALNNRAMTLDLLKPVLGRQISPGVFEPPQFIPAGKLDLEFSGCRLATAAVRYSSNSGAQGGSKVRVGTGSFRLQRLGNSVQAKRCTGGISDNTFAGERAVGLEQFISTPQLGVRAIFERRPDASDFRLEFRDLPVGTYSLLVGDVPVRQFAAVPFGNSTKAEIRFRSPALPGISTLLDFDVPGQTFSLIGTDRNNQDVRQMFTITTPLSDIGVLASVPTAGQSLSFGERFSLAQVRGIATNTQSNFLLDTQYDRVTNVEEFKVAIEGAPPGAYDVFIDGTRRGQLIVRPRADSRNAGEVFFRSPVTVDSYPLDFDPRGVALDLYRDGVLQYGATLSR